MRVARDPRQRAQLEFDKGVAYEVDGETGEAEDCYEDALDHDKNHLASLRNLGRIKTTEEEPDDAIPLLKRVVELTDGSPDAYNDLGYAYDMAGFADPAEAAYLRGIRAEPSHVRLRTNYGLMLARHGRTNEAPIQLRAAMSPADAYYNLAVVLENQGKRARADASSNVGARRRPRPRRGRTPHGRDQLRGIGLAPGWQSSGETPPPVGSADQQNWFAQPRAAFYLATKTEGRPHAQSAWLFSHLCLGVSVDPLAYA